MKQSSNFKILSKILIFCVLTLGLLFVASDKAIPVSAKSCYDAEMDFYNALDTYDAAFYLYYYNNPSSCADVCSAHQGTSQYQTCLNNCEQTRHTDLGNADIAILQAGSAINSCTNPPPDYCSAARGRAGACAVFENYLEYEDFDERLDRYGAYSDCRNASGVDNCQ